MNLDPSFLIIDKPPGLTSHDVVDVVRAVTGISKVGHTGTLDPFATGVLPLALGAATRLIQYLDESEKVYDATIALGASTDTGDPTGRIIRESLVPSLDEAEVLEVLAAFVGPREQRPPSYSAVKVQGKRLYEYARAGHEVEAQPRLIHIHGMRLLAMEPTRLRVLIHCSRGTYARVLADEIASACGTAGHLCELSRLRSGPFRIEAALGFTELSQIITGRDDWETALSRRRGEERVPWRPLADVHEALRVRSITVEEALSNLPSQPLAPGVAEVLSRGGKAPPPPVGAPVGARYTLTLAGRVVALGESLGGGQARLLWRDVEEPKATERRARGRRP
jgi:tRNA pseudouridine55 synthase